jgi:hypothetical protein
VVLFDPAARTAPPCLNVLQGAADGSETDVITDNITGIFRRIYAAFWGPRTDDIFRAAVLTLLRSVPAGSGLVTLADIPSLLGSDAYRRRKTSAITDPVLKGFWEWYEQLSGASRAHAVGPLMNKLRAFLLRPFVAQAIAAGPSTFTMSQVLDEGGLLLARLPKGVLGEETCRLLGSFILAATWQPAKPGLPQASELGCGCCEDASQSGGAAPVMVVLCLTLPPQACRPVGDTWSVFGEGRQRRQLPKPDHCVSHALCDRRGVDSVTVTGQIITAVRKRAGRAAVAGRCQPGGASGVTAVGVPAVYLARTRRVPAVDLPGEPGGRGPARPGRPAASGQREPGRRQARAGLVRRHR